MEESASELFEERLLTLPGRRLETMRAKGPATTFVRGKTGAEPEFNTFQGALSVMNCEDSLCE